jgi:hypothetical protein
MKLLSDAAEFHALEVRVRTLRQDTRRLWGRMTSNQMLCHLCDSFRFALGERTAASACSLVNRTLVKWIALHTSLPWPRNVKTRPEVDQTIGGTPPTAFERDRSELLLLMKRFTEPCSSRPHHPIFGPLTEREWQHWGWRHVDHHLRQFGV